MMNLPLYRPEPVSAANAQLVDRETPPKAAARRLIRGELLKVADHYGIGVKILAALHAELEPPMDGASFSARLAFKRRYREAANRLLAPIAEHRLALADAQPIGFLAELYPKLKRFSLPFPAVQELHGAWLRYQEGTRLAVIGHRVHPFYGTYAPTRTSHLELFGTWLSQYTGPRAQAIDVGTGCGVLALMLAKAGFQEIMATDSNPNAVESLRRELLRITDPPSISLVHADLMGEGTQLAELVVFNPPWVRGEVDDLLDQALNFEDGLFERFFSQAAQRLQPDGRVVLIFSNVIQLLQPDVPHPILSELERGRFKLVQKLQRKVKPAPGKDGRRRRTREKVEVWELAPV